MSVSVEELVQRKTKQSFPNIKITEPNETMAAIVKLLETGDMQLIVEKDGKKRVVGYISESALNISKLLRTVSRLYYVKSETNEFEISHIEQYLDCVRS